ncbi:MAG: thioredoxin, partial [Chloroflexi bacterium]|nr:thioredoxin [Chloroflexota bacterium]
RKVLAVFDVPIHTSAQNVGRALAAGLPILLSFEVPVCEHCRALAPTLEELARMFVGRALILRVDNTEEGALASRYRITRVPTLIFWRDDKEQARIEGAVNFATVRAYLEFLLGQAIRPPAVNGPSMTLSAAAGAAASMLPHGAKNGDPVIVTDATFETLVLQSPLPTLVDFWAPWCGPCRPVSSAIEDLGHEYVGRMRVGKVNTDENPAWAGRLGIMGIPTLIFFKRGREVDRIVGAASKASMRTHIEQVLSATS